MIGATFPSDLPHGPFLHRRGPARNDGDFTLSDRDLQVDGAPLG